MRMPVPTYRQTKCQFSTALQPSTTQKYKSRAFSGWGNSVNSVYNHFIVKDRSPIMPSEEIKWYISAHKPSPWSSGRKNNSMKALRLGSMFHNIRLLLPHLYPSISIIPSRHAFTVGSSRLYQRLGNVSQSSRMKPSSMRGWSWPVNLFSYF